MDRRTFTLPPFFSSQKRNFSLPFLLLSGLLIFGSCDSRTNTASEQATTAATAAPLPAEKVVVSPEEAPPAPDTALTAEATTPAAPVEEAPKPEAKEAAPAAEATGKKDPLWPVKGPEPLAGAILPHQRIVAYYGNPLSKRMGILGELPPEEMLAKLDQEVAAWVKADPKTPVKPALHLVAVTAQGEPGKNEKYRMRMSDAVIEKVLDWAESRNALVFLDIQVGHSTLQEEIPALAKYLQLPHVHLGVDAEFSMKDGAVPGKKVGTYDAEDLNYASSFLANLVKEHQLPPKVFIVHRFTQRMITNYQNIKLRPEVQIVMHMDGWGPPELKKGTYRHYIYREPVQYTGFKLFYHNDTKKGHPLMKPEDLVKLTPAPVYIQYQ